MLDVVSTSRRHPPASRLLSAVLRHQLRRRSLDAAAERRLEEHRREEQVGIRYDTIGEFSVDSKAECERAVGDL